ncbi:hypothetical protein JXA80_04690 [bacterium]|nr:hypothetical protein [candidate division CSSED10-310 bacterium]
MYRWVSMVLICATCTSVYAGSPDWHWTNPKPQGNTLNGLWMATSDEGWAVGEFVIMHWDGSAWSVHAVDMSWYLSNIYGFAENDIWASGSHGLLLHWNGASWQTVMLETTGYQLGAIWGFRSDDVWMQTSTKGILYHFDGSEWALFDTGLDHHFIGFWGAAADDVWAIGDAGVLLHWDGNTWTQEYLSHSFLSDIFGTSANDVRAIGTIVVGDLIIGMVFRWDGTEWTIEEDYLDPTIDCIWGAESDDVWIAGGGTVMYHWDGSAWNHDAPDTHGAIFDMAGLSGADIWGCGAAGTLIHWDGTRWHQVLETPGMCSAVDDLFALLFESDYMKSI